MNKILTIKAFEGEFSISGNEKRIAKDDVVNEILNSGNYDGYQIITENNEIFILIENGQDCCENWGCFSTEDELQNFIGAELLHTTLTDTSLTTELIDEIGDLDAGSVQFVTFQTNKGVFQLAVYNAHNGYYGHEIAIFKDSECLLNTIL